MWMIMTLALSLFHGEGAGHFIAVGPNDGPHERLIRLTNHISSEELALIFNRYSIFGFLYRKPGRQGMECEAKERSKNRKSNQCFHA